MGCWSATERTLRIAAEIGWAQATHMRPALIALLFLVGCADLNTSPPNEETTTWNVWLNHGLPGACHGYLTMYSETAGGWECGDFGGPVDGRLYPDLVLMMDAAPGRITIRGAIAASQTGAHPAGTIVARTDDGRPFVGYLIP